MAMEEIDNLEHLHYYKTIHKRVGDEKLLSEKYWTRFETFALNELLGRPVPNVINLNYMLEEAMSGDKYISRIFPTETVMNLKQNPLFSNIV